MARQDLVSIWSEAEDSEFKIEARQLREVAKQELGMTDGPIELTIFTKTILATALQREQVVRNQDLQRAMTEGGDWKSAMKSVAAVTDLMEKFGIDDAQWSPTGESKIPGLKQPAPTPTKPVSGSQPSLDLDGQKELQF